ncbi:MAG TPA: GNAT family N-acetyltransferase [Steroidobacteraceae bacterium]|jgi:putative acetyltransferase
MNTWVLCECSGTPVGFLVLKESHIDALFVAPERIGMGGGSALLRHARSLHPRLTIDVNEQNEAALNFYLAKGFSISGRSETDEDGRPYPLLHLSETPR